MSIIKDIKESPIKIIVVLFIISSMFYPGFLFLFVSTRNLFLRLDIWRLLILSFAITIPFFIFNFLLLCKIDGPKKDDKEFYRK